MAYGHKEILAKHQKIHDMWLDRLAELTEKNVVKGTYAILGYVEREWNLICNIEDRMNSGPASGSDKSITIKFDGIPSSKSD